MMPRFRILGQIVLGKKQTLTKVLFIGRIYQLASWMIFTIG